MVKYEPIFKVFAQNLHETFEKLGLKLKYEGVEIKDELYLCPISLCCYTIEGLRNKDLTLEHVPPQSLGGKGIVLTSKAINNNDGLTSDKKLLDYFKSENFKTGKGDIDVKISSDQFQFKGVTAKFVVGKKADRPLIKLSSTTENIKVLDFKGLFDNWNGGAFKLTWKQQMKLDKRAMLKCAYLTVFSKVGYSLIFDSNGLKQTYGSLIEFLSSTDSEKDFAFVCHNDHAPFNNSMVGLILEPEEYKSIVVNLIFKLSGKAFNYSVFLPHPDCRSLDALQNLEKLVKNEKYSVNFKIAEIVSSSV